MLSIPAVPISIHLLKSKLCVGCTKGFEILSLETSQEPQSLLDPADTSLDFVARREDIKPIAVHRLEGEFLLNYSDFSFFVNKNGWRCRPDWMITWEGQPNAFALSLAATGYILAFEPSFIEIRDLKTAALVHIVTGKNIRMLHESNREVCWALIGRVRMLGERLGEMADMVRVRCRLFTRMKMSRRGMMSWRVSISCGGDRKRCRRRWATRCYRCYRNRSWEWGGVG